MRGRGAGNLRAWSLAVLVAAGAVVLGACSPSLEPLYRDFDASQSRGADGPAAADPRLASAEAALVEAGWTLAADPPAGILATEPRTLSRWGLYRVEAYVEVVPMNEHTVRVLWHPYRKYVTGGRSKIPFLTGRLRRTVVADLEAAMEAQGLTLETSTLRR